MKALSGIALACFIGAMFASLFHISVAMDMSAGMHDCPFMVHEEVLCPMNLAGHINAWKASFLAITPSVVLLLAVAVLFTTLAFLYPCKLKRETISILYSQLLQKSYAYSYRPLQELFSSGVLHPKLY